MCAEVEIDREANLLLLVKEEKLGIAHDRVMGAQTVKWQGEEKTARQMEMTLRETDREARKKRMGTAGRKDAPRHIWVGIVCGRILAQI